MKLTTWNWETKESGTRGICTGPFLGFMLYISVPLRSDEYGVSVTFRKLRRHRQ